MGLLINFVYLYTLSTPVAKRNKKETLILTLYTMKQMTSNNENFVNEFNKRARNNSAFKISEAINYLAVVPIVCALIIIGRLIFN